MLMGADWQMTLCTPAEFSGVGLHSGADCRIVIHPAAENTGIRFCRIDLEIAGSLSDRQRIIGASPENVSRSDHGTSLVNDAGVSVATVEHLMGALAICGVDNALIDVDGPEIPILDGSSAQFVSGVMAAATKPHRTRKTPIQIEEALVLRDGDREISVEPAREFSLDVLIDFEDCMIGRQSLSIHLNDALSKGRLAKARTFCRLGEVESLRDAGLIRGGSLDNSIVVDGDRLLNGDILRDPDEFVLHKALDLIGDLYLLGAPICGAVRAIKPGHSLNTRFARALSRRYLEQGVGAGLMATA